MFADPITVAANAPTPSIVWGLVKSDGYGSNRIDTGANGYFMKVAHIPNAKNGDKHYMQITQQKDVADPFVTGLTRRMLASASLTLHMPPFGWTSAQMVDLYELLTDTMADSEVTVAKFLLNQS